MQCCTVMSKQRTEHTAMGSSSAQCDGAGGVPSNPDGQRSLSHEVQDPVAERGVQAQHAQLSKQMLRNDSVEC